MKRFIYMLATPKARSWAALVVLGALALVIHPSMSRYGLDVFTTVLLYVAAASAWNLVGGFAGQFSLAHSVFVGGGSYIAVIGMQSVGLSAPLALLAATLGAAVLALIAGLILFRLRDAYFTVGSLALAIAAMTWMTIWKLTGGTQGVSAPISAVPKGQEMFLWALIIALLAVAASITIFHSAYGLRLMSVRDDEDVADSLGVSPLGTKLIAMVVSGALTGAVGAAFAMQRITVEPFSAFSIDWTMTFIVMAIIGGIGTVWGPVIGAVAVYYGLTVQLQSFAALSTLISGAVLILVIRFAPGGIIGVVSALRERFAAPRRRAQQIQEPRQSQKEPV